MYKVGCYLLFDLMIIERIKELEQEIGLLHSIIIKSKSK